MDKTLNVTGYAQVRFRLTCQPCFSLYKKAVRKSERLLLRKLSSHALFLFKSFTKIGERNLGERSISIFIKTPYSRKEEAINDLLSLVKHFAVKLSQTSSNTIQNKEGDKAQGSLQNDSLPYYYMKAQRKC